MTTSPRSGCPALELALEAGAGVPVNDHDGESARAGVGGAEVIDGVDGAVVSST